MQMPIDKLSVDEIRTHRKTVLEPMVPEATNYLKSRNALTAKDGSERPELIALEDRIIECTLLMVARVVEVPIDKLSVDEIRTHRKTTLEPMVPEATNYLKSRSALTAKDGSERPELITLEDRIIECTLLMVTRVVEVPIDKLDVDGLKTHRKTVLEPMVPEAANYLKSRNALTTKDEAPRPELGALEDRIIETTLAMVERVLAIPLEPLDIEGLLRLRGEQLEPMQPATTSYLAGRNASKGKDGVEWPQLVALEERIIAATLLTCMRLVAVPIEEMEVPELNAFRTQQLEPRLKATLEYLTKRDALADPQTKQPPRKEVAALEAKIQSVRDRVRDLEVRAMLAAVAELVAKPIDELDVPALNALRTQELEPMVVKATAYLEERKPMHVDPSTGQPWPEMRALDARILEVIERVRFLEVQAMLAKVTALVEEPIEGMGVPQLGAHREKRLKPMVSEATEYLTARNWLLLDGQVRVEMAELQLRIEDTHVLTRERESTAMRAEVARAAAMSTEGLAKEALFALRTGTLEPTLAKAETYLEERGWATIPPTYAWLGEGHGRDDARPQAGEPPEEMVGLAGRIKEVVAREISLMMREVTLACDKELDGLSISQLNEYRERTLEPKLGEATSYLEARNALLLSSGKPRPEMNMITLRIQEVKDRVLRMEVRAVLDEIASAMAIDLEPMTVDQLRKHADELLEPLYVKSTNFLSERGVLLERGNRERPQLAELAERIANVPQRILHLEVESTLSDISEKVARPLEPLSVKELTTMRNAVLQPTLERATTFLGERGVLKKRGLRQVLKMVGAVLKLMPKVIGETGPDGEPVESEEETSRPEVVALEARIEETIVRGIELTIAPLVAEMAAAVSLEPKSHDKDDLHALRVKELEPLLKRAVPFLEKEGGLVSRTDGARRPELVALEERVVDLKEQEVQAVCRDMLIAASTEFWNLEIDELAALLANELEPALSDGTQRLEELGAMDANGSTRSEVLSLRGKVQEVAGRKAELEAIKAAKEAAEAKRKMQLKRWSKAEASALAEVRAEAERRAYAAKVAAEEAARKAAEEAAAAAEAERIEKERLAEIERKKREAREALERERKARMQIPEVNAARVAPKAKDMLGKIMPKREMLHAGQRTKGRLGMHAVLDLAATGVPVGAGRNDDGTLSKSASAGVLPPVRATGAMGSSTRCKGMPSTAAGLPPRGYNPDPFAGPPKQPTRAFGDPDDPSDPAGPSSPAGGGGSPAHGNKSVFDPVREPPKLLTGKMSMASLLSQPPSMGRTVSAAKLSTTVSASMLPTIKGGGGVLLRRSGGRRKQHDAREHGQPGAVGERRQAGHAQPARLEPLAPWLERFRGAAGRVLEPAAKRQARRARREVWLQRQVCAGARGEPRGRVGRREGGRGPRRRARRSPRGQVEQQHQEGPHPGPPATARHRARSRPTLGPTLAPVCGGRGCIRRGCIQRGCARRGCIRRGCIRRGCIRGGCIRGGCERSRQTSCGCLRRGAG